MSTFEVHSLSVDDILAFPKDGKTYIEYEKSRPRISAESGMSFYTMLIKKESRFMRLKLTFGPTPVTTGPWPERKFPGTYMQIGIDNKTGEALYAIAKRFERDYNEGKLNVKGKKPRNLSLPLWEGTEEKKTDNPKVKIALSFNKDLTSKFTCTRNTLLNGELETKIIACDSKNCHDIFKYGTIVAGDIIVTYNIHPARGLSLVFEGQRFTVKQAPRPKPSPVSNLTRAQMLEMVDDDEEKEEKKVDDTIEEQLNRLELME